MGRQPCCDKIGMKRGQWTIEEDQKLMNFILTNGIHCWRLVPKLAGLMRCGKSCRLRWTNYLRPDLKRGVLSEAEEDQIIQLHSRLGNRWSMIASHFPGRTDNEIKNHWNTRIKKRLRLLGLDPVTHKPIEQPEKCGFLGDHDSQSNENLDNCGKEDGKAMEEKKSDAELDFKGLEGLSNGHELSCGTLELEEMKPQGFPSSSSSTSFSLDDTMYPSSVRGDSSVEDSKLYWADNIDNSFPSWEALYQLEDILSFGDFP